MHKHTLGNYYTTFLVNLLLNIFVFHHYHGSKFLLQKCSYMTRSRNERNDRESQGRDKLQIPSSSLPFSEGWDYSRTCHPPLSFSECLSIFRTFDLLFAFTLSFALSACSGPDWESGELTLSSLASDRMTWGKRRLQSGGEACSHGWPDHSGSNSPPNPMSGSHVCELWKARLANLTLVL